MTLERQQSRLKLAAGLVILTGVSIALAAHPATAEPMRWLADLVLWPLDGRETWAAPETRLLAAILGGVMAGWGVALWLLAGEGMAQAPDLARRLIGGSVLVWFAVDSAASLAAGAPLNLLGNLVFLALFLVPLRHRTSPVSP